MRILWTDKARTDPRQLERFLLEARETPASAIRTILKVIEATGRLAQFPGMGRPGRVSETRELVVPGTPYILPYRVKARAVHILRVLHGSQKWPDSFR